VEAAQSVAQAVQKVADAAVAEIRKTPAPGKAYDFVVVGTPGGRFEARSANRFSSSGTILLGGHALQTNEWGASFIAGTLPPDAKAGDAIVDIGDGRVCGYYHG